MGKVWESHRTNKGTFQFRLKVLVPTKFEDQVVVPLSGLQVIFTPVVTTKEAHNPQVGRNQHTYF